jgi:hypothetical protein
MKPRLYRCLLALMLVNIAASCADYPTSTRTSAVASGPSENVYVPREPGECDPWLDASWCERDPSDGDCMTSFSGTDSPSGYAGAEGCDGPGDPGGGGNPTPDAEPSDTCNTGDAIIDDPEVSKGLRDLWSRSNPDANLYQRRETAGWIVQTAAGYSIVPITTTSTSFGCADLVVQPPTNGTVVAFVHTHPYQIGETIVDCEMTNVQYYSGGPSDEDRIASKVLGNVFGLPDPLPGYFIDKDGYYRFDGSRYTAAPRLPRCGY